MILDSSRLMVMFKRDRDPEQFEKDINPVGLTCEAVAKRKAQPTSEIAELVNDSDRRYWIRLQKGARILNAHFSDLGRKFGRSLEYVAPVYRLAGTTGDRGLVAPLPAVLLMRPREGLTSSDIRRLDERLSKFGLTEVKEKSRYLIGFRYFEIRDLDKANAFELAARIQARLNQFVKDVRFETVPLITPMAFVPNDTFYENQWSAHRIQASLAWDMGTGDPSVVVAVIDSGCDLTHPDLQYAAPGVNLRTLSGDGSPRGGHRKKGHGTCCAGIIAARIDNNQGVAGIAGRCRILPLALDNWSPVEVATGLVYAADNGARVISMSFGSVTGAGADIIDPTIEYAYDRGCVLCAASGNDNNATSNDHPARHPLVMACGGSSTDDNRKSPESPDGDHRWGANYGPGLSVVAPCVGIPTTDIQGRPGYNREAGEEGDYFMFFNGTSSATPHVAALAALCLSMDPRLTNRDVRDIIEQTAERVGSVAYATMSGYPNGTRNQQMGYGRINALNAVAAAAQFVRRFHQLLSVRRI